MKSMVYDMLIGRRTEEKKGGADEKPTNEGGESRERFFSGAAGGSGGCDKTDDRHDRSGKVQPFLTIVHQYLQSVGKDTGRIILGRDGYTGRLTADRGPETG